jgi:predicted membrane protein
MHRHHRFSGPEKATRFAHRLDRHHHRMHRRFAGHGHPIFGFILLTIGVLFLLDNTGVIEVRALFRTYWPALLIFWGGFYMFAGQDAGARTFATLVAFAGAIMLGDRVFGWQVDAWDLFWPALLILIGLGSIMNAYSRRPPSSGAVEAEVPPIADPETVVEGETGDAPADTGVDASAAFAETAILSGIERRNVSQSFQGGTITAIMGGVEIDLRECRMAASEAHIDLFIIMGGVELRIPKEWTVESRVTAFLAGFEDRSDPPVAGTAANRLILRGSTFMGGVEIRN